MKFLEQYVDSPLFWALLGIIAVVFLILIIKVIISFLEFIYDELSPLLVGVIFGGGTGLIINQICWSVYRVILQINGGEESYISTDKSLLTATVAIIIMFLVFFIHKKIDTKENTSSNCGKSTQNIIEMKNKELFYSDNITTAKFENGMVYCIAPNNPFHIGNYRIEGDHVYVGAEDDREIGNVTLNNGIPSLITLTNIGWYRSVGIPYDGRRPLSMVAAELFYFPGSFDNQIIIDNQTSEVVATYKGDPIGAAAAFVCMQYECSRYGRCHDFYHSN